MDYMKAEDMSRRVNSLSENIEQLKRAQQFLKEIPNLPNGSTKDFLKNEIHAVLNMFDSPFKELSTTIKQCDSLITKLRCTLSERTAKPRLLQARPHDDSNITQIMDELRMTMSHASKLLESYL
jgi:hypothetical protein